MTLKNQYTYLTEWSNEDNCFISRILEFPSLSAFGDNRMEAERELDIVVEDVISWMKEKNEPIPDPISFKEFKGNISLRIPPQTHHFASLLALRQGISLNQYITSLIERNMYNEPISNLVDSFENKIQAHSEAIQKMTLLNFKIFEQIFSLSKSTSDTRENQEHFLESQSIDSQDKLLTA